MAATPRGKGRRIRWWRVASAAIMALLCLLIAYQLWLFCMVVWYAHNNPGSSSVMRQELARLQTGNPRARLQFEWADYDRIDDHLKRAVIAAEDSNFVNHGGVEWEAIRQAWEYNQDQEDAGGRRLRGGSTITQQLAKNLFLSGSRTYLRKGQELILAYMIEWVMPKRRILELYLNIAEWGVGVFGAQAAASHYFNGSAARLGPARAARMAAMLPNPRYYDKHRNTAYLNRRTAILQQRMRQVQIP